MKKKLVQHLWVLATPYLLKYGPGLAKKALTVASKLLKAVAKAKFTKKG